MKRVVLHLNTVGHNSMTTARQFLDEADAKAADFFGDMDVDVEVHIEKRGDGYYGSATATTTIKGE